MASDAVMTQRSICETRMSRTPARSLPFQAFRNHRDVCDLRVIGRAG